MILPCIASFLLGIILTKLYSRFKSNPEFEPLNQLIQNGSNPRFREFLKYEYGNKSDVQEFIRYRHPIIANAFCNYFRSYPIRTPEKGIRRGVLSLWQERFMN